MAQNEEPILQDTDMIEVAYLIEISNSPNQGRILQELRKQLEEKEIVIKEELKVEEEATVLILELPREVFKRELKASLKTNATKDFLYWKGKEISESGYHQSVKVTPVMEEEVFHSLLHSIKICSNFKKEMDLHSEEDEELIETLHHTDIITKCFPIHHRQNKRRQNLFSRCFLEKSGHVSEICEYFGTRRGFYFAWVTFYTQWLIAPAALGLLGYYYETEETGVDNLFTVLYSLFMIFWSGLFIQMWRRKVHSLQLKWNLPVNNEDLTFKYSSKRRRGYFGKIRKSPITNEDEVYFSSKTRNLRRILTFPVIFFMLILAVCVMTIGLNINGYMTSDSPIYIPILNSRNPDEPGMLYPDDPLILTFIPGIVHALMILTLNTIYSKVAFRLTEWENPKTDEDFERSLIFKRVPFEMFDCYLSLFYLAFWDGNMSKLRTELMSLFLTDTFRRLIVEAILPTIMYSQGKKKSRKLRKTTSSSSGKSALKERELDDSEDFDDWIELVVQFGYITLFAGAFPLASTMALVANIVEKRSDLFKYLFVSRRQHNKEARDIGPWLNIMEIISTLSVLTNCGIFGYTSNQVETLFIGEDYRTVFGGHSATCFFIVFFLEHVVLCIKLGIDQFMPEYEHDAKYAIMKKAYIRNKALTLLDEQDHDLLSSKIVLEMESLPQTLKEKKNN